MKKIALLGSTGSIGRQVLEVVDRYPEKYKILSLCCNSDAKTLSSQIQKYRPVAAGLSDGSYGNLISELPEKTSLFLGNHAMSHCILPEADIVFVAVVGFCGLSAVLEALSMKKTVALANKEALVAGGRLVCELARHNGAEIIPVDSEHSALWQALSFDRTRPFKRIILTASGGAFRDKTKEELENVTPEQALRHPNWKMGAKITVDCATMFNKGLEVMEAMWLYGCGADKIKVLIHPESAVHSMVEFADNAVIAQLARPSMEIPIQLALSYPDREYAGVEPFDFTEKPLTFYDVPKGRYPCFDLAMQCAAEGGVVPCAASGANEEAVKLFLKGAIKFNDIAYYIENAIEKTQRKDVTYENLVYADFAARKSVYDAYKEKHT